MGGPLGPRLVRLEQQQPEPEVEPEGPGILDPALLEDLESWVAAAESEQDLPVLVIVGAELAALRPEGRRIRRQLERLGMALPPEVDDEQS